MTSSIPISPALLRSISGQMVYDTALARAFETGEAHTRRASNGPVSALKRTFSKYISNASRIHPKSPDRKKSVARRRMLGGSSCMPDKLREIYTEGERAALWVVVQEVKRSGSCTKTINGIAAAAGVSRTTVQNAIRKARHEDQKHISVEFRPGVAGRLSDTNVIRIVSGFWLRWLGALGGWFKQFCPSRNKAEKYSYVEIDDESGMAFESERAGQCEPSIQPLTGCKADQGSGTRLSDLLRGVIGPVDGKLGCSRPEHPRATALETGGGGWSSTLGR